MNGSLEDQLLGRLGRQRNLPRVLNGIGQRRLTIDVLARFQRRNRDSFVLFGRRGDNDGLDLFVLQDRLVIFRLSRSRSRAGAALQERFVRITDGGDVRLRLPTQRVEDFAAPRPQAN
jgi:hypothetical protein